MLNYIKVGYTQFGQSYGLYSTLLYLQDTIITFWLHFLLIKHVNVIAAIQYTPNKTALLRVLLYLCTYIEHNISVVGVEKDIYSDT